MMNDYQKIILAIVREQESIIGPVALQQASTVEGLNIDLANGTVQMSNDPKQVVEQLVEVFRELFGNISVEVCKTAAHHAAPTLQQDELPAVLRG